MKKKNKKQEEQLRLLGQSIVLEEATAPYRIKTSMLIVSLAFLAFVGWLSTAQIKEVARTSGEIVPTGHVQTIQHLEGGIVSAILVKEDQLVDKDQVLMRIRGESVKADMDRLQTRQLFLETQRQRMVAFLKGDDSFFTQSDEKPLPSLTSSGIEADISDEKKESNGLIQASISESQGRILAGMIQKQQMEKRVLQEQITQKNEQIRLLKSEKKTTAENLKIAQAAFETQKQLYNERLIPETAYLSALQEKNDRKGKLAAVDIQIKQAVQMVQEYRWRLKSLDSSNREHVLQQLGEIESEIAENSNALAKLKRQADRLELRSPVQGVVKGLEVNTLGGVIAPGQKILEIVPAGDDLIAEVQVSPADIGHIQVGDSATVKVTSFDFSRYGFIDGTVAGLSATTFVSEKGMPYYKGVIHLKQNYVGPDPDMNTILPGMIVNTDIITGEKSILAYLLKPIHLSISSAFIER